MITVILAAGKSQRMGFPKALLMWNGHTFIEHLIAVHWAAGIEHIVIVSHAELLKTLSSLTYPIPLHPSLSNPNSPSNPLPANKLRLDWLEGNPQTDQLSSLQCAIDHLGDLTCGGLLVGPVDQGPFPTELAQQLLTCSQHEAIKAWVPSYQDQRGHPVLLGGGFVPYIMQKHPLGLRGILTDLSNLVREMPTQYKAAIRNLNTFAAYAQFVADGT